MISYKSEVKNSKGKFKKIFRYIKNSNLKEDMTKSEIQEKIFEILKQISESKEHTGLLIVFSDLTGVLARGAHPLGKRCNDFKEFNNVWNINNENVEETIRLLKKIGADGAILIDDEGSIYSPAVYLNVNIFSVDENLIEPEFCARHIAALATSSTTEALVYALSEETGKIREFIKGEVKRKHPSGEQEKILEIIKQDLREHKIETKE